MISSRLTQRGRGLYFTALLIDEGEETFVGEIFLGDFLYLLRGDFVYLLVEMLDVLETAIATPICPLICFLAALS